MAILCILPFCRQQLPKATGTAARSTVHPLPLQAFAPTPSLSPTVHPVPVLCSLHNPSSARRALPQAAAAAAEDPSLSAAASLPWPRLVALLEAAAAAAPPYDTAGSGWEQPLKGGYRRDAAWWADEEAGAGFRRRLMGVSCGWGVNGCCTAPSPWLCVTVSLIAAALFRKRPMPFSTTSSPWSLPKGPTRGESFSYFKSQ